MDLAISSGIPSSNSESLALPISDPMSVRSRYSEDITPPLPSPGMVGVATGMASTVGVVTD